MGWWVHDLWQQGRGVELVSWIFWVLLSITLHELGHGWAAIRQGDDTPIRLQRMTLNPVVHMGLWSLAMFAIIGIAWGVMPVDPSRFRDGRRGRVYVAAAGPVTNVALAFVALTAAAVWVAYGPAAPKVHDPVLVFLMTGGLLNIVLAVFNLLPMPPLDGANILSGLSLRFYQWYQNPQAQVASLFLLFVLIAVNGFSFLFMGARLASEFYVGVVSAALP